MSLFMSCWSWEYLDMKVGTAIRQISSVPTDKKIAEIEAPVVTDILVYW